jgi:hypothetical protein
MPLRTGVNNWAGICKSRAGGEKWEVCAAGRLRASGYRGLRSEDLPGRPRIYCEIIMADVLLRVSTEEDTNGTFSGNW